MVPAGFMLEEFCNRDFFQAQIGIAPGGGLSFSSLKGFVSSDNLPSRISFLIAAAVIGCVRPAIRIRQSGAVGCFLWASDQP